MKPNCYQGIILITVPTIQYGGYFLLTSLMDKGSGYMDNPLRQNFFRAGHAHAGVIVILSLVCQILADAAYRIFLKDARKFTGNFLIDDSFLASEGVRDFERYRVDPSQELAATFFVPDAPPPPPPGVIISGDRWE